MKKRYVGLLIAGLIGICPVGTYAADQNYYSQPGKIVGVLSSPDYRGDYYGKHSYGRKKDESHRDQERKWQERRDRGRREEERREQERRERERKEQERREREREDARYIIHHTAPVIYAAQRAAGRRHYYSGLALAVAHQQKARELYMAGFYREAIFLSLRARRIAILIIERNGENWFHFRDEREEKYKCDAPGDNELDLRLNLVKMKDHEAVRISINLDI